MIELLKPWVINIVVITIFVIIADIILPEGSIKRYVRVIIGIFVLLAIIQPLINIKNIRFDFEKSYLETSIKLDSKSDIKDKEVLSAYQKDKALEIYESKLIEQIITAVSYKKSIDKKNIEVILNINKDKQSSEFGLLNNVKVIICPGEEMSQIEKIKKVKIGNDEKVIYKEEKEYNLNEKTSSDEICEMLSKMLGIDKNKIQVKLAVEKE
ncbi:stage III sporulation protein AF [Lutispora saccharofermentans]|uniref:Stage III sporulation protein AF n=1 Tax=Lutispora saccharofermentans TaxID=3024236 RepID=A0ABT1NEZ1_9FIRM|nr:stage III sporulation protein AF [Lutispora saccharofermentans]MCQ1529823.1 stage III sporulation protein AF [Lutispora saccharofermentans]